MNKIVQLGFLIVVSSMLAACCNTSPVNCGAPSDKFRIGLSKTSSPGNDIKNWQCFLQAKGFGPVAVSGKFGDDTAIATQRFQATKCYEKNPIAITGTVNLATFLKAVRAGMPKYKTVITKAGRFKPLALLQFRYPMALGCSDVSGTWGDVTYWQSYLDWFGEPNMLPTSGVFYTTTQTDTMDFQDVMGVKYKVHGVIDLATFTMAENNGMPTYTGVSQASTCNH
jgi:hypothetical protein